MSVLVYGHWSNQTKNIISFFTASYTDSEKKEITAKDYTQTLHFVFVGSLVTGKRPMFAIKVIEALRNQGYDVNLAMYGDGVLKPEIEQYIVLQKLEDCIVLHGNQSSTVIKTALSTAHFTLLASKSEGWPKAIAEAMFFGVIPIATAISCVPNMLDYGKRGILVKPQVDEAVAKILLTLTSNTALVTMSRLASEWSQQYTLNTFETEIKKLLKA